MIATALEQLLEEHRVIIAHVVAFQNALGAGEAPLIRESLDRLCADLLPHLKVEDEQIYPLLVAHPDTGTGLTARETVAAYSNLAAMVRQLDDEWTADRIGTELSGFTEAASAMLNQLTGRVQAENQVLYPMALRTGLIRLRAA